MSLTTDYARLKASLPAATVLFLTVGDFHETYMDDATLAAPLLRISLTKRNGVPMCGFPTHSAQLYLRRLVAAGKTVAVANSHGLTHELDRVLGDFQPVQLSLPILIAPPPPSVTPPPSPTIAQLKARGAAAMKNLTGFIGHAQRRVVTDHIREAEERQHFVEVMERLATTVATMPRTYHQNGKGDQAIAYLHYFTRGTDIWITEKDQGSPADAADEFQSQAYGFVRHGHMPDCADTGYVSLPEILSCGAELDFHFTPTTLSAIKAGFPD